MKKKLAILTIVALIIATSAFTVLNTMGGGPEPVGMINITTMGGGPEPIG